jgi:hypothetical protein
MKCDAGAIACAIDRLTKQVADVSTYDWWAQIGIPLLLGLLTLGVTAGVAVASVLVARRSNALARQSNALARLSINLARKAHEDAQTASRLAERTALGLDLVEMLTTQSAESRGFRVEPSSATMHRALRSKLRFLNEPGSNQVLYDTTHAFRGLTPEATDDAEAIADIQVSHEHGISVWVRDPSRYVEWKRMIDQVDKDTDDG